MCRTMALACALGGAVLRGGCRATWSAGMAVPFISASGTICSRCLGMLFEGCSTLCYELRGVLTGGGTWILGSLGVLTPGSLSVIFIYLYSPWNCSTHRY